MHHLIVDSVSWRILAGNLKDLYEGKDLGLKGSSYRQWVDGVEKYGQSHSNERKYWTSILADADNTRFDHFIGDEDIKNVDGFELDREETRKLLRESHYSYHTQINDILLSALSYTLFELTGGKVNHIILEGHGREEIDSHLDITNTVGWFTTMYPVRLEVNDGLGNTIKTIKETLRRIPNRGIGFGPLVGYHPEALPKISFNYLGQFDREDNYQASRIGSQFAQKENYSWDIIEEEAGIPIHPTNRDCYAITITGIVIDGRFKLNVTSKLDKNTTTQIAILFKKKLDEIICHTNKQTKSYLTASDVNYIITQAHLDELQSSKEIQNIYLANSLQQGFIYHALNQGDIDDAYKVQIIWQYRAQLKVNLLKEAWKFAQKTFSCLRLRFAWEEDVIQIIDKEGNLDWRYIDLSSENVSNQEKRIKKNPNRRST